MFLTNLIASCLFALAPISNVPQIEQVQQYNEVYENKNRYNLVDNYGWLIITPYELLSRYEFLTAISSTLSDHNTDTTPYYLPPYWRDNVYYLQWFNVYIDNPELTVFSDGSLLNSISILCSNRGSNGYNRVEVWDFVFTFNNNQSFTYNTEIIYNDSVTNPVIIGATIVDLTNQSQQSDASYYLVCRSSSYIAGLFVQSSEYQSGYNQGYRIGYDEGYSDGQSNPNQTTRNTIYNEGRQVGYQEGLEEGLDRDSVASTIFTGFVDVGLLPVNVFLQMFQYEVFGINIAGLMSGVLTIAIVVIIVRLVTGKKND